MQLLEDALDVGVNSTIADLQILSDFLVEIAFGQEVKDLLLSV